MTNSQLQCNDNQQQFGLSYFTKFQASFFLYTTNN